MEPVAERLFQIFKRAESRAVAGVILGRKLCQVPGGEIERCPALLIGFQRPEVESAHEHVGPQPLYDVQNALVGTAADDHEPSAFPEAEILFVREVVRLRMPIAHHEQILAVRGKGPRFFVAGAKPHVVVQRQNVVRRHDAGMPGQRGGHAYFPIVCGEVTFKGAAMHIDGGVLVHGEEAGQTSGVIVVPVGHDGHVHKAQIYAQMHGVAGKGVRLSCVEENAVLFRFDVEAQTVLGGEAFVGRGVFQKRDDLHVELLVAGLPSYSTPRRRRCPRMRQKTPREAH